MVQTCVYNISNALHVARQSSRAVASYKQELAQKDSLIADLSRHLEEAGVKQRMSRHRHRTGESEDSESDSAQVQALQHQVGGLRLHDTSMY